MDIDEIDTQEEVSLFTHPENPPDYPLGLCEGDCDKDSDCADGLFCFFKTNGVVQRVPGCAGSDKTSTDFCVDNQYRTSDDNNPLRQSLFSSQNTVRGSTTSSTPRTTTTTKTTTRGRLGNFRTRGSGILEGAFKESIP